MVCCGRLKRTVIETLERNYSGVLDLNVLRAKDGVMGVWGFMVFGVQLWEYEYPNVVAFWLCIGMNLVMVVDLVLRLIDPRFSMVHQVTDLVREKFYPVAKRPWPPTAGIARMVWFLFEISLSIFIKFYLDASDWRVMIVNVFFSFWLIVEAVVHFCPILLVYVALVKSHIIPADPDLQNGDCIAGSFLGPTCTVTAAMKRRSAGVPMRGVEVQVAPIDQEKSKSPSSNPAAEGGANTDKTTIGNGNWCASPTSPAGESTAISQTPQLPITSSTTEGNGQTDSTIAAAEL